MFRDLFHSLLALGDRSRISSQKVFSCLHAATEFKSLTPGSQGTGPIHVLSAISTVYPQVRGGNLQSKRLLLYAETGRSRYGLHELGIVAISVC
jgi:hypothetical protein